MVSLAGRRVAITGSAQGIGRATGMALAEAGTSAGYQDRVKAK